MFNSKLALKLYFIHALTAEAVNPAFVEPIPVVKTDRGHKRATYLSNWDFATPAKTINLTLIQRYYILLKVLLAFADYITFRIKSVVKMC